MRLKRLFTIPAGTLLPTLVLWAVTAGLYALAAAPTRALQLWSFSILFGFVLLWKGRSPIGQALAFAGFALCWADAGIRGFLRTLYGADPKSTFILESVANTHPAESIEYLQTAWFDVLLWTGAVTAALLLGFLLIRRIPRVRTANTVRHPLLTGAVAFLTLLFIAGAAVKPWRTHWPILYWPAWYASVSGVQERWKNQAAENERFRAVAAKEVAGGLTDPRTVVLVVGESTVRDNMSLYGYARPTTPLLEEALSDPKFLRVRPVWSVSSSTIAAFEDMFEFETASGKANLFAFYREAGYKVTWISNQDDIAIKNRFAAWDDAPEMINRLGGRSSTSLDENVLPAYRKALADPAPRHLIVLHLIGLHPHYGLRHPESMTPDWPEDDPIDELLEGLNRSGRILEARDEYDLGIRYQDRILDETLREARGMTAERAVDWIYVSDHGQELGDYENRTGHSNTTPDGYRVPLLLWTSDRSDLKAWENRPMRTDGLSAMLLHLSGILWKSADPKATFLHPHYVWQKPDLPFRDPELDRVTETEGKRRGA